MRRCITLARARASGLGVGVNGVGFGMLRLREDRGGKSLRAPGRRENIVIGRSLKFTTTLAIALGKFYSGLME
jgi:hypothetical protein